MTWTQDSLTEKESNVEVMQDYSAGKHEIFNADLGEDWFGETKSSASHLTVGPAPVFQADSSAEKLPADLEAALYRFGGDRVFMMEMCQEFKDHLPSRMEEIKSALHAGDINSLGRFAHN